MAFWGLYDCFLVKSMKNGRWYCIVCDEKKRDGVEEQAVFIMKGLPLLAPSLDRSLLRKALFTGKIKQLKTLMLTCMFEGPLQHTFMPS